MLEDTTFIIPLRIESTDRLRNVITTLIFLLSNFNSKIILQEEDTESKFKEDVLPQITQVVDIKNLNHIFVHSNDPIFHRTRIINEMLSIVDTKVVCNYDCDILLRPQTYIKAEKLILNDGIDCVYPYGIGDWQYQVNATDVLVTDFINDDFDFSILEKRSKIWDAKYGFCQFFNLEKYIKFGMENENFISYGYEDDERHCRFTKLSNISRLDEYVYHLEHSRTQNSWFSNPHIQDNKNIWEVIKNYNKSEILDYYKNQDYLKKYK